MQQQKEFSGQCGKLAGALSVCPSEKRFTAATTKVRELAKSITRGDLGRRSRNTGHL